MVIKSNKSLHIKRGFSLAEALVSMLILSMFFVATSKIITIKQKDVGRTRSTGYYECYKKDGKLYQKYSNSASQEVAACTFNPPYTRPNKILYSINNKCIYISMEVEISDVLTIGSGQLMTNSPSDTQCTSYLQADGCEDDTCTETSMGIDSFMSVVQETYPTSGVAKFTKADFNNYPVVFIAW